MKNKDLQEILQNYPDDMEVKLCLDSKGALKEFETENITDHAPDDIVTEKGNLHKGKEPRVIVINPPVY